jgi:sugar phosphate permease
VVVVGERGRRGLLILAATCLTYFTENFLRSSPSALSPVLIEELGISYGVAGLLFSSYYFLYALMQVPSGMLSDTLGPRRTIIGFTVFTVVGTVLFSLSRGFWSLLASQLLIGLGSSVFYINAVRIISGWFLTDRRASAIGILSAASGLGNFAAYIGLPLATAYFGGWRILFVYCAGLMIINFLANFAVLRDDPDEDGGFNGQDGGSVLDSLRGVLVNRGLRPILAGYILMSLFWVFFMWMPQFLTDRWGLSYIDVGLISSAATITGIPGCILVGVLSDRLRSRKTPLVALSAASTIILGIFLILPLGTHTAVFAILMALLGLTISVWVLFFSIVPEVLPREMVGVGLGLLNGAGTLVSSLVSPIFGILVDVTGSYTVSQTLILAAGILMTIVFALFIGETYGMVGGSYPEKFSG